MANPTFLRGSKDAKERAEAPKHDVTLTLDEDTKAAIEGYAKASGITFDEAVAGFASRGASNIKQTIRRRLRGR